MLFEDDIRWRWLNFDLGSLYLKYSLRSHALWATLYLFCIQLLYSLKPNFPPLHPINKKFPHKEFRTFPQAVLSYINALYGTQFRFLNFIYNLLVSVTKYCNIEDKNIKSNMMRFDARSLLLTLFIVVLCFRSYRALMCCTSSTGLGISKYRE